MSVFASHEWNEIILGPLATDFREMWTAMEFSKRVAPVDGWEEMSDALLEETKDHRTVSLLHLSSRFS